MVSNLEKEAYLSF